MNCIVMTYCFSVVSSQKLHCVPWRLRSIYQVYETKLEQNQL